MLARRFAVLVHAAIATGALLIAQDSAPLEVVTSAGEGTEGATLTLAFQDGAELASFQRYDANDANDANGCREGELEDATTCYLWEVEVAYVLTDHDDPTLGDGTVSDEALIDDRTITAALANGLDGATDDVAGLYLHYT